MELKKITYLLNQVQAKQKKRLVTPDQILMAAKDAEYMLACLCIPKKYRQGCVISHTPESMPQSYNWTAMGTAFSLERGRDTWTVKTITRTYCPKTEYGCPDQTIMTLSQEAREAISTIAI